MAAVLSVIFPASAMALGALYCFFGYRFFRIALGICGFLMGCVLAHVGWVSLLPGKMLLILFLDGISGIVLGLIFVIVYMVGLFALGASFGALLGVILTAQAGDLIRVVIASVLALTGGLLALFLQRLIIILSTSFSGAWGIVAGAWYLAGGIEPAAVVQNPETIRAKDFYAILICWTLLGVLGSIAQYKITAKKLVEQPGPPIEKDVPPET